MANQMTESNNNSLELDNGMNQDNHDVIYTTRRLQEATNQTKGECEIERADPVWMIAFYVIGVLYMFLALAIVCDEFFVPALEEIASERHLNLSMDVAGATLMAAGGSAPELFTSLFGTFQESEVGIGTIVGSAVFNVLFVIGCCALAARELLTLTWWPLFRDCLYYTIGLIVLSIFVGVVSPEQIYMWEALVLFIMYLGYIVIMYFNRDLYKYLTGKELVMPEEREEEEEEEENGEETNGDMERPKMGSREPSQTSLVSQGSLVVVNQAHVQYRGQWNGTFRAGILKLLRDPDSWLDTAGVGIVSKISGDVDHVFREVDLNDDGHIDREELEQLFVRLECHLSPQELDEVFRQLDEDNDGRIDELEFTKWYMRSEERVLSQVKHVFDSFDVDKSGTIDRHELKMLLEKLEPRVSDKDVEEAIDVMYQSGSRDEITFDEFSDWYKHSMIFERQKKEVEEDMQGVWESLKPPRGGGCLAWTKYILVFPLVLVMTFTIPDTKRPGLGKWCYFSFSVSIVWIAGFSWLMVWWAEVIGNTIGIPSVVMGLTVLAAGTSVPDLLTSVIVARRGNGDMALSSSIGSNLFDILVGLPLPWFLYTVWPTKPNFVYIGAKNIWISIFILIGMLVFITIAIHCQGWKLTKMLGTMMFFMYFAFLAVTVILELPFEPC
jgi:K+-dependent Na+/Ca+ exchanger-like protein